MALAKVLEEPVLPRLPALVHLKAGTKAMPIFVLPGASGNLMEVFRFVEYIETGHPIWGLHPRGVDGLEEPFDRIEDLAQFHVDAIRALQARGPYILVGYSLGGLVAMEIAQRLLRGADQVALLVMVETYPHWIHMPIGQKVAMVKRRAKRLVSRILRRAGFLKVTPVEGGDADALKPDILTPDILKPGGMFGPVMQRASDIAVRSLRRYRPRHYEGRINFVRATRIEGKFADDPIAVWAHLADDFVLDTVPGNHWGVVTTHSKRLGALISRYIEEISD